MFEFLKAMQKLPEVEKSVAQSFAKVKQDTDALYQWITFLYQQNQTLAEQNAAQRRLIEEQKLALNELKVTVMHMPKTAAEIKQIVDSYYSFEPIMQRIKHMEQKLELLDLKRTHQAHTGAFPLDQQRASLQTYQQHVVQAAPPTEKQPTALKEKLMRKLARNSKDYIKNLVLGLVHKYGKMGALQLREIVVEEQGLCSKSSFYRILEEMEKEQSLHIVSDGKHTVYMASAQHAER